jgi:hypothetical protein
VTEQEAADKLGALLNEIEQAGVEVSIQPFKGGFHLAVGADIYIMEPPCEDEPWEVVLP